MMRLRIALLAGLLISTSANAEVLGTFTRELANSDKQTIVLMTEKSTHPYCNGKTEALSFTSDSGMRFRQARGCWDLPGSNGQIPVHLYRYSDGSEIAAFIDRRELKLSARAEESAQRQRAQVTPVVDAKTTGSLADAVQSTPDTASVYYAGVCEAMQLSAAYAKSADQKEIVAKLRDAIAQTAQVEPELVADYCAAKARMYHSAQN